MTAPEKKTIELTEKQREYFLACERQIASVQDMMRGALNLILTENDLKDTVWTLSEDRKSLVRLDPPGSK